MSIAIRFGLPVILAAALHASADVGRLTMPADQALERIGTLRSELASDAQNADKWTTLAWLMYRYGQDTGGALEAANRACTLDPDHFKAHELAGRLEFLRGHDEKVLDHWLTLLDDQRPEVQLYLSAIANLARSQDQRQLVTARMKHVARNHPNQLFRTLARRYLAGHAIASGRIDDGQRIYAQMGTIDQWMIIGPFNNERDAGYNTVHGPETEIDYDRQYQGRDRSVSWRPLEHLTFDRNVDFAAVCYPRRQVLAYAVSFIHSPVAQKATLRLGVDKSIKVWFNERLAFESELERRFVPDQATVLVQLHRGYNKLLVKVGTETGSWRLAVRLTDPQGRPLDGVSFSRLLEKTPDQSGSVAPEFIYTLSMMDHFERVVRLDPNNEDALYYLGLARQNNQLRTEAGKTFERLARLNDRCADHHRLAARAYLGDDKAEKGLAQMKLGLEIDPDNLQIRLMMARFYNNRRLYQKQRTVLDEIARRNPDWRQLQFQWVGNYVGEGWEELAFRKVRRLYEDEPTDLRALVTYAQMCAARGYTEQVDKLFEAILQLDAANGPAHRQRLGRAVAQERFDDAFAVYDLMHRLNPVTYDLRLDRAKLLTSLKRYGQAIEQCRLALDICPTDYAIHRRLGVIYQRMNDDQTAREAFKTALEYRPDHRWLRQYVEYLEPRKNAAFEKYALSDEQVDELLAREVTPARYPKSDSVFILDEMVTQVFDDGSSTHRIHQIIRILDEAGRNQWNRVALPGGTNRAKRAVVIQPDGSEIEAARISDSAIHFAQLQPGSTIDYVVVGYAPANDWISHHYGETFLFQSDDPMILSRFVVLTPKSKPLNTWHRGDVVSYRTEDFQEQKVHLWEAHDTPRIESEPNQPPFIDLCAQVRVSTIPDWDEVARWEHSLIKEQFEPDHDLISTTRQLTRGLQSTKDKIRAVSNFVSQNIQYKIVRGGIFGYKPNKAANVLHNEWGDCKDKATLLITMLDQIGIEARYATLRTRDAGQLLQQIPSNQCNHAIVYIPKSGDLDGDLWVDGTAMEQGISSLPWGDQNVTAMVWDDDGRMNFMKTPLEPPDATVSRFTLEVALKPDGSADVTGNWTTTGQIAVGLRSGFRQVGQRAERLTQVVNSFAPGGVLADFAFSDLENRDQPVSIDMRFSASNYAVSDGSVLTLRTKRPIQATAKFAPRDVRHYDVWLPFRQTREFTETYLLPNGYSFQSLPEPVELSTPWMDYVVEVAPQGQSVRITRRLIIKAVTIPRDRYDEFRQFCIRVDENENQTVVRAQHDGG